MLTFNDKLASLGMNNAPLFIMAEPLRLYHSHIPRLIYSIRRGRKMSQVHLAGLLGVSSNYIYMIEAGRRLPSVEFCLRFASLFSINPPWIESLWLKDYITHIENRVKDRLERAHYGLNNESIRLL